MTAILDAILYITKRSMMPEWHQLDSSSTMPQQQESIKKKTLKSSSRSFWFSTGLLYGFCICIDSAFMGRSTPTTAFDGAI